MTNPYPLNNSNGELIFEGEYSNGKRWNGKGYDRYGNITYEFKNRKRNGKGKEYNEYGRLLFEGEYLNGKRNGKGKNITLMKNCNLKENI